MSVYLYSGINSFQWTYINNFSAGNFFIFYKFKKNGQLNFKIMICIHDFFCDFILEKHYFTFYSKGFMCLYFESYKFVNLCFTFSIWHKLGIFHFLYFDNIFPSSSTVILHFRTWKCYVSLIINKISIYLCICSFFCSLVCLFIIIPVIHCLN